MRARRQLVLRVGAAGLSLLLLAGCTDDQRQPGEPVTEDDAAVLAELLHLNHEEGGADFVVTVPFADEAVLTLTGQIDFRRQVGQAQAVTVVGSEDRDTRTLFFDRDDLWAGDVPGLAEALAADGAPEAAYLRRTLSSGEGEPPLLDVLVQVLQNLAAERPDRPAAFLDGPYRWQGEQAVDGRPATVYRLRDERTVAIDDSDRTLVQYRTPLGGVEVTVTLAEHGTRRLALPTAEETAEAADHPEIAEAFGI
ncbi:hypothetical protein SAMN04515665_11061 [Blastococcus sp. DSM 46786]|uniref:hypothetical protein n=1 Tax=Blastococcus sp. DSM 46786 TaxID=1798227 RepID=UPI0008BFECA8|nr:hypothetical protein [Blastococcus sp. DSM 46786]SEL24387.1 hypothetical protein SAMN04515665_11061 [Blastococcus sp. DSM 46786]